VSDEKLRSLAPPEDVVLCARSVMGAIDFDPYSNSGNNRLVQAASFLDETQFELDDVVAQDWQVPGDGRAFVSPPGRARDTRRLLNKTLRVYRKGIIKEAVLWVAHNESIIKLPWLWDFPACIPFRRCRPCWWDEELETFRAISMGDWSAVFYLPPSDTPALFSTRLARFHGTFSHIGRVVFNEMSGEGDWETAYKRQFNKPYDYRS
jgi:hypothetical protein